MIILMAFPLIFPDTVFSYTNPYLQTFTQNDVLAMLIVFLFTTVCKSCLEDKPIGAGGKLSLLGMFLYICCVAVCRQRPRVILNGIA